MEMLYRSVCGLDVHKNTGAVERYRTLHERLSTSIPGVNLGTMQLNDDEVAAFQKPLGLLAWHFQAVPEPERKHGRAPMGPRWQQGAR